MPAPKDFGQYSDPLADPRGPNTSAISSLSPAAAERAAKVQHHRDHIAPPAPSPLAAAATSRLLTHPVSTIAMGILAAQAMLLLIVLLIWIVYSSMQAYARGG